MNTIWRPDSRSESSNLNISDPNRTSKDLFRPEILDAVEAMMQILDADLRSLSLDIHAHPELGFEEKYAHQVFTAFMSKHRFQVTRNYMIDTAWLATFSRGVGGRTIGINSEMDALKGIGHACGHNLIGMAGAAIAICLKAVMEQFDISGTIQLLGTPAEEGGSGKVILMEKGAYKNMDVCLMCHPAPGPRGSVSLSSCLALQRVEVEYFGHTAHAALSPWEGINALDAAVLGYNNISALRQQLKPTYRVHGIFEGKDWATNIIPDYAKFTCYVRAPTRAEQEKCTKRVLPCFQAAALATGCRVEIHKIGETHDLRQNKALGDEVARITLSRYGGIDYEWGIKSASTDFGNVTYAIPSLHPGFAIPTVENGGNHTPGFTEAAASKEAHYACLDVSKALAATAARVLLDDEFYQQIRESFEEDKLLRNQI